MPIAFVAGATGYTGREVVRLLAERGIETYAHIRPDSKSRARFEQQFTALESAMASLQSQQGYLARFMNG